MGGRKGFNRKRVRKTSKIICTYEIVDRLRRDASQLLDDELMEVSDELIIVNDTQVTNNSNTMNSLDTIPTTEIEPTKPACYAIMDKFELSNSIATHYYNEVLPRDNSKDKSWRKHLSSGEKRRFQIMKRVIKVFEKRIHDVTSKSRKKSLVNLKSITNVKDGI